MEQEKREVRIQIEAPHIEPLDIPMREEEESLPVFYKILLSLTFLFSSASLFLAAIA